MSNVFNVIVTKTPKASLVFELDKFYTSNCMLIVMPRAELGI